jgi:hypothetical protein
VRRLTLLAILAVAGCGGGHEAASATRVAEADRICQNAAVPGIPIGPGIGPNLTARLAQLTLGQERREVRQLRALGWRDLDAALVSFERALPRLEAFVRSHGRARGERTAYGRLIDRWRRGASDAGLDICSRFGFAY